MSVFRRNERGMKSRKALTEKAEILYIAYMESLEKVCFGATATDREAVNWSGRGMLRQTRVQTRTAATGRAGSPMVDSCVRLTKPCDGDEER